MKTDLVLVSYNSKKDLEVFLPSIRNNTSDYNLVIVDNGSGEETTKYLYDSGERVIFQENKGFGAGCNEGAARGNSEIVVFLNCDLIATENWLENLLKPFQDSKVVVAGARLYNLDNEEYPTAEKDSAIGCCMAVRRSIFDELGGFDENFFLFFEEVDFCKRVREAGYKVVRSEAKLIHTHPHFFPLSPELQKHWDKSEKYFKEKHKNTLHKPTLALVMVVKNEEKGLKKAILSCKDFVDEIVIAVDNSSTDRTNEIAQEYADVVKHFDWQDDFSWARNFAQEGVKTDWILFLDGHEYIDKIDRLETFLNFPCDGLICEIEMEDGMRFGNPRIYRNGIKFVGRVHERQECKKVAVLPTILIKHDRLTGQSEEAAKIRAEQRDDQILRIMGEEYQKSKKNIRASFHLALHFQNIKQFKKSNKWWKRYLKFSKSPGERWYAYFSMSLNHYFLNHLFRSFFYSNKANEETPGRWEISKLNGLIRFRQKEFAEAAQNFVDSFHQNKCIVDFKPWPQDRAGTFNLIGECLFNQGIFDRAGFAFWKAAEVTESEEFKSLFRKRGDLMFEMFKSKEK